MMQLDTKRHPEEENAALREEIARLRVLLYGKKSERVVAANLDLSIEEVPAKDEPNAPATDKPQQNKTDTAAKRTRRLRVHYTREIEETLIPDEVKAAPADYERLPESAERVSVRVESVPAHPALRRAIDYAIERREMPESWLNDPNIPIDNNAVERAVRPVTIGRKNSLFIGAPEAGQHSAILYTMMEECKRCKVDSLAWLTWVLNRLPNYRGDYSDLYPEAMPKPEEQVKQRPI